MNNINELIEKCINIFGLDNENTEHFINESNFNVSYNYLNDLLNEMIMYKKINDNNMVHIIIKLDTGNVIVVEMINQSFDFYVDAWDTIRKYVYKKYPNTVYFSVVNIITD